MKANRIAIAIFLGLAATPFAFGGAPARLELPIDGITPKNTATCLRIFSEKLNEYVVEGGGKEKVDVNGTGNEGHVVLNLQHRTLALETVEEALAGTEFRINRHRMGFHGAVRIVVGETEQLEGIVSALKTSPEIEISTLAYEDGNTAITIQSKRLNGASEELPGYGRIAEILEAHKTQLLSVRWGIDRRHFAGPAGADWFGRKIGASRVR